MSGSKHPAPPMAGVKVPGTYSQRRGNLATPPAPHKRLNHDLAEVRKRGVGSAPSSSESSGTYVRGVRGIKSRSNNSVPEPSPTAKKFISQEEEEELNRMAMMKQLEKEVGATLTRQQASAIMNTRTTVTSELTARRVIETEEVRERSKLQSLQGLPTDGFVFDVEGKGRGVIGAEESSQRDNLWKQHTMHTRVTRYSNKMRPEQLEPRPSSAATRFVKTQKMLGKGAFGMVYEGYDEETGRFVAIKEVMFAGGSGSDTERKLQKITQEVRVMKKLNHPHIVQYIAADRQGTTLFIYMELISGGSLTSALSTPSFETGFPERVARTYTKQICSGLSYLHSLNVAHRDIKGDNILLEKSTGNIKLADFNSSKQIGDLSINHGMRTLAGTPWYMAPEVIQGLSYGLPADIWSLGITVIEMLTGRPPFVKDFDNAHAAMFHIAKLQDPYPLPAGLSVLASEFLRCTLLRDPKQRHTVSQLSEHPFVSDLSPKKANSLMPIQPSGGQASPRYRQGYEAGGSEGSTRGMVLPSLQPRGGSPDLNGSHGNLARLNSDHVFMKPRKDPLMDLERDNVSPSHLKSSAKLLETRLISGLEFEKRAQQQQHSLQVVSASLATLN